MSCSPPVVVVCADDFGMSQGVGFTIADLLERDMLSATTCLVDGPAWPATVGRLRRIAMDKPEIAVGLHFDLPSPWVDAATALVALRAQWRRFEQDFGRPPDFIDGHRHVHLFPGPRRAVLGFVGEIDGPCWLRQCQTSSSRVSLKRLVLDVLSLSFRGQAAKRGCRVNPGFGGLRRFNPNEDLAGIWRRDLAAMVGGGVLMTHPGPVDPADPISACRAQEAALLARGVVAAALAGCGLAMGGGGRVWSEDPGRAPSGP